MTSQSERIGAEILDRAKISRSTFYIHFLAMEVGAAADGAEQMVAFSLPLFSHIEQHRRSATARLGERGRAILHQHLRRVLSGWIIQTFRSNGNLQLSQSRRPPIMPGLLAEHIASTFVLVLHWWLDQSSGTSSAEADKLFRALVIPVLRSAPP